MSTLRQVWQRLQPTYCRSVGVQFMHIDDAAIRDWLSKRLESTENRPALPRDVQVRILTRLTDAEIFEEFVRKKYISAKMFSLEGAESLIPLLDLATEKAVRQGVNEIVIGMVHRGRLNVLANILGKRLQEIFWEFEDPRGEKLRERGLGDVKYHLGYSSDFEASNGQKIHLSLCFNPSHLEFINPVALGRTRAKQDRAGDHGRERALVLLIHCHTGRRRAPRAADGTRFSPRGTFSQRHAVWHDAHDGRTGMPLAHVAADQARIEIYNSPLTEAGALGFE